VKSQDIQFTGDVVSLTGRRPGNIRNPYTERLGEPNANASNDPASSAGVERQDLGRLPESEQIRLKEQAAAIIAQAREEAKKIKESSFREGYAAGSEALTKDILHCIRQVSQEMSELQKDHECFCQQYESSLLSLAASISSKILCKRISEDDSEMDELVRTAVETVRHADWISIEVSERMAGHIKMLSRELQSTINSPSIEVTAKNSVPGLCLIKTPQVVLDASVSTQLENLKRRFQIT
jgi:flagellar biosynthesis/type III secretory pathway protein FliH